MKRVELSRGMTALVSDIDHPKVSKHSWHAVNCSGKWYARRNSTVAERREGAVRSIYMHRQLCPSAQIVDHVNGDSLDNRRENLRPATHSQNGQNRRKNLSPTSSPYKGVNLYRNGKWRATISDPSTKTSQHIGYFLTETEAAQAYDAAAISLFGTYALTNFRQNSGVNA